MTLSVPIRFVPVFEQSFRMFFFKDWARTSTYPDVVNLNSLKERLKPAHLDCNFLLHLSRYLFIFIGRRAIRRKIKTDSNAIENAKHE